MKTKNNIELFNICVGLILGRCYQSFPIRIDLNVLELGDELKEITGVDTKDHLKASDLEFKVIQSTIEWLKKAGYIWFHTTQSGYTYHRVTLSPKGLEVLNVVPDNLTPNETSGEKLSRGAKELGKASVLEVVKATLTAGAKLAIEAVT